MDAIQHIIIEHTLARIGDSAFTDISDLFGFTSLSHFSRYVQNNLGAKPSDFRE